MSIIIMNMEMPKEKKITLTIFPDGRVYENHGERLCGHGKDCIPWKAVPVPKHGRLIDADALVDKYFGKEFLSRIMTADEDDLGTALVNVPLVINNAPTIIPADTTLENEIHIIDTKGKPNYDPKRRFIISSPTIIPPTK